MIFTSPGAASGIGPHHALLAQFVLGHHALHRIFEPLRAALIALPRLVQQPFPTAYSQFLIPLFGTFTQ